MLKNILFIGIITLAFSCSKEVKKKNKQLKETAMEVNFEQEKYTLIKENYSKKIEAWKFYNELASFLTKFKSTTPNEALANALDLERLTQHFKDSSSIELLKKPAFKARVNVFNNEVLRLADMTRIPSIKAKEVNQQIDKILQTFGSFNAKTNSYFLKESLELEVKLDSLLTLD